MRSMNPAQPGEYEKNGKAVWGSGHVHSKYGLLPTHCQNNLQCLQMENSRLQAPVAATSQGEIAKGGDWL